MNKIHVAPDYSHSILNLANSILADFGCTPFNTTLPELDNVLAHGKYTHVALIVCDAMGSMNIDELLKPDSFLCKHRIAPISSVFPPTTTAATTTLMSGLSPAQHGWIGWRPYLPELHDAVELFPNNIPDRLVITPNGAHLEHPNEKPPFAAAMHFLPYTNICTLIKQHHSTNTDSLIDTALYATFFPPTNPYYVNTFQEIANAVLTESAKQNRTYTYCYWPQPDYAMHHTGVTSKETHAEVDNINTTLQHLELQLREQEASHAEYGKTLVIVTADHGHIDSTNYDINDYPDILSTLTVVPCLEERAVTFFVKESERDGFPKLFYSHFKKEDFLLLTKEELLESKLFGPSADKDIDTQHKAIQQNPLVNEMLGDFIAIGIGNRSIFNSRKKADIHKGVHAGLSQKELLVPLITF